MSPLAKYVLRNLGTRPFITALVLTTMMVVGATVGGVTAIGTGLRAAFSSKGHDNFVIVTARGATSEKDSVIPLDALGPITVAPEIKRFSPEAVTINMLVSDRVDIMQLRGLEPQGFEMHGLQLLQGRMPTPGAMEMIIGETLLQHLPRVGIGANVKMVGQTFTCVGVFRAGGFFSGEAWTTRAAFKVDPLVNTLSVVYLETSSAAEAQALASKLTDARASAVNAVAEPVFYGKLIAEFDHLLFGMSIVFLLVVTGAVLAAASLISVFQQRRLSELCVMRAMGFRTRAIAFLILYETELMVLVGGAGGVFFAALGLRHYVIHTLSGSMAAVTFTAPLTPDLAAITLVLMVLIGIAGSILPIIRMARTEITRGLREE